MTVYMVLRSISVAGESPGSGWKQAGMEEARSARSAIRSYLDSASDDGSASEGEFVAVPYRSWKPVTVKVETKTELKFS